MARNLEEETDAIEFRGHGIIVERGQYDHLIHADARRQVVAQGRGPAGSYNFFQSAEAGPGRLARNADTVRKMGKVAQTAVPAPQEAIDELEEGFRPYATNTSRGHGLGIKERVYDNIIEGWQERSNPSRGSGNAAINGVLHGSSQKGNQRQGRLARNARPVRKVASANRAAIRRDVLESSAPSSG